MTQFWRRHISPDTDLHKVLITRDKLVDAARGDRVVKIKTYYPVLNDDSFSASGAQAYNDLTNLPVIIWSHGLGGSVDGAAFLSRFIASHGFIIVHVQHHGTDSSLWEGKDGHPWDIIRDLKISREATLNRYADIPFLLDQLPAWFAARPEINKMVDLSTLGMSGHSFGALTTQVMAGMTFPNEDNELQSFKQEQFKAGILYSPGSIEHLGDFSPADVYPSINIPLLHMTGTDDGSPLSDQGYEIRLAVYEHSGDIEKHMLILKDGDHMVYNGSRGKLGQNPNREKHEAIIKVTALAYWEAMLKEDNAAHEWLTGDGFSSYLKEEGEYQFSKG